MSFPLGPGPRDGPCWDDSRKRQVYNTEVDLRSCASIHRPLQLTRLSVRRVTITHTITMLSLYPQASSLTRNADAPSRQVHLSEVVDRPFEYRHSGAHDFDM
jgi:hypothetical protein